MKKPENEKQRNLVKCYMNDEEFLTLKALSIKMEKSNSEILRMFLTPDFRERIEQQVEKNLAKNSDKNKLAAQEKELIKNALYQLSKVGNNLNQLTKSANQGVVFEQNLLRTLEEVSEATKALRERIEHGNSKTHRSKKQ